MSLEAFCKCFPCKIDTADVMGPAPPGSASGGQDTTLAQIKKDLLRDRIIIQGQRVEGAESGLEGVLRISAQAATDVITASGGSVVSTESLSRAPTSVPPPSEFSSEMIEELCITALQQIGRTESAFVSFSCLHHVVDMTLQPDIIVVPESTLARPLLMRFRRDESEPSINTSPKASAVSPMTAVNTQKSPATTGPTSSSAATGGNSKPMSIRDRANASARTSSSAKVVQSSPSTGAPVRRASSAASSGSGSNTSGGASSGGKSAMMSYIHAMQAPANPLICDLQAATVYRS